MPNPFAALEIEEEGAQRDVLDVNRMLIHMNVLRVILNPSRKYRSSNLIVLYPMSKLN